MNLDWNFTSSNQGITVLVTLTSVCSVFVQLSLVNEYGGTEVYGAKYESWL